MNFFKRLFCRHEGKLEHICAKENPHIPKEAATNGY